MQLNCDLDSIEEEGEHQEKSVKFKASGIPSSPLRLPPSLKLRRTRRGTSRQGRQTSGYAELERNEGDEKHNDAHIDEQGVVEGALVFFPGFHFIPLIF